MIRRVLVVALLSVGMAVSGSTMAQAASVAPAAPVVATPQVTATPTFDCVPGIISTVCGVVARVICRTPCTVDGASAPGSTAAVAAPSTSTAAAAAPSTVG